MGYLDAQGGKTMKRTKKWIFSVALTAIMVLVLLPAYLTTQAAPDDEKFLAPIEPIADKTGWIAISDRAGLEAINNNLAGKYYLTADIDLSNGEWTPIGSSSNQVFTGTLDGQGYVISGLTISGNRVNTSYEGLFARLWDATVKNVGMEGINIDISSNSMISVGGIAGYAANYINSSLTITNCYVQGNVSATSTATVSTDGSCFVGGIVGRISVQGSSYPTSLSFCANAATVVAQSSAGPCAGGIVGYASSVSFSDSHNSGEVKAISGSTSSTDYFAYAGGISGVGHISQGKPTSFVKCSNIGNVTSSDLAGGICAKGDADFSISNCFNTANILAEAVGGASGSSNAVYAGGLCGQIEPSAPNTYGASYSLVDSYNTGNVSAVGSVASIGGLCGFTEDRGNLTVSTCYNEGNINANSVSAYMGGLLGSSCYVGIGTTTITDSRNSGAVTFIVNNATVNIGGLAGRIGINNTRYSFNEGNVTAVTNSSSSGNTNNRTDYAGGLYGNAGTNEINNCYNTGNVSLSGRQAASVGGISANGGGPFNACYNTGDISGISYNAYSTAAGISSGGVAEACYNSGNVNASGSSSSGISASGIGTITTNNCFNAGNIIASNSYTGTAYAGGICSNNGTNINNCYSIGNVSASTSSLTSGVRVGSIAGAVLNTSTATFEGAYWNIDSKQTANGTDRTQTAKKGIDASPDSAANFALTAIQMKKQTSFVGFNFASVWTINSSATYPYPTLVGLPAPQGWAEPPTTVYGVTVTNGSGGGNYSVGITVTITASTAPTGQEFDKWTGDDVALLANVSVSPASFTMPARNVSFTATYKAITAPTGGGTIVVLTDGNGTATANGQPAPTTINAESDFDSIALRATANSGYTFSRWVIESGSGNGTINRPTNASASLSGVKGNMTIKATFNKSSTGGSGGSGGSSGSGSGGGSASSGGSSEPSTGAVNSPPAIDPAAVEAADALGIAASGNWTRVAVVGGSGSASGTADVKPITQTALLNRFYNETKSLLTERLNTLAKDASGNDYIRVYGAFDVNLNASASSSVVLSFAVDRPWPICQSRPSRA
jgi:uncharacterized membrane protein YgcG